MSSYEVLFLEGKITEGPTLEELLASLASALSSDLPRQFVMLKGRFAAVDRQMESSTSPIRTQGEKTELKALVTDILSEREKPGSDLAYICTDIFTKDGERRVCSANFIYNLKSRQGRLRLRRSST